MALHKEGLALCKDQDDRANVTVYFEGLACEAATAGEARRTATLFGKARALREAVDFHLLSGELAMHEPYPGPPARGWTRPRGRPLSEGRAMTFEDANDHALSAEDLSSPLPPEAPPLTRREREVAKLVARGRTNAGSPRSSCSPNTRYASTSRTSSRSSGSTPAIRSPPVFKTLDRPLGKIHPFLTTPGNGRLTAALYAGCMTYLAAREGERR